MPDCFEQPPPPPTAQLPARLRERGVVFCITSSPPPRGLRMFIEPLDLTIAMAPFQGGVIVRPDRSLRAPNVKILATAQIERRTFPSDKDLAPPRLVARVKALPPAWKYDVVSIGYLRQLVADRAVTTAPGSAVMLRGHIIPMGAPGPLLRGHAKKPTSSRAGQATKAKGPRS